jgi:Tfp pilus assembly PilM family ATPase
MTDVRDVLAIEVTSEAVRALRLGGIGPGRAVRAYVQRRLPPGLVVPSSGLPNVQDEGAFARLLTEVVGPRPPRRARLVLPDRSVRLHVLNADAVPPGGPDLRQFLVWRLQDTLPFEPREARVAYVPAPNGAPNRQVAITLVAREQVLEQYERLLGAAGTGAAHVAPAACHLFNLAERDFAAAGDAVHAFLALGPESAAVILSQRATPEYARTFLRPGAEPEAGPRTSDRGPSDGSGPCSQPTRHKDLVAELLRSFEHAEEQVNLAPPARLLLGGELGQDPALAAALQESLGIPCAILPSPPHRVRHARPLPPEAHAVLLAALARI